MIIISLNAPMSCGKDEMADYFVQKHGAVKMELKELLTEIAVRSAGVTRTLWDALYTREYKEIPSPYLIVNGFHVSPRQWMIHISENVMKPVFGKSVFGDALVNKIKELKLPIDSVIVLSDGGFPEEAIPIIELVGVDGYRLVRIHRYDEEGNEFGWGNDSRSYLRKEMLGIDIHEMDAHNMPNKMLECADDIWNWATIMVPTDLPF